MFIGIIKDICIKTHRKFDQYADVEINTDVNQPSGEQKQQPESVENQQQKTSNTDIVQGGYCTRSGRLVKVPDRY